MDNSKQPATVRDMVLKLREGIVPIYGAGEAGAMIGLIFHHLRGWSRTDIITKSDQPVSDSTRTAIADILRKLITGEPIQYVLGEAYFYGMNLKVDSNVLIPRPETEELVDMIVKRFGETNDLRVLDIGTGSGAIAIALSRNLPFSKVTATDISAGAIEVAKANADMLKAKIDFKEIDMFKMEIHEPEFNIIVSNPPYIDESERASMERNVLDYEPASALFVPDSNPLIYYSRIIEIAQTGLKPGGMLYFEINPRHADDLAAMMRKENFTDVEIITDSYGHRRFIYGQLTGNRS